MHTLSQSSSRARQATFVEVPFKALDTCHEDIAAMLGVMSDLADGVAQGLEGEGIGEKIREKARAIHLFFSGHAIEHHLDEERHIFPALLAAGKPELISMVRKLQLDHALLEARWMKLGPLLHAMVRGYRPSAQRLQEEMRMFIELYRRHMALEDAQAYPCARHLLNAEAVRTMNLEMAHRRVKDVADEHDDERWA